MTRCKLPDLGLNRSFDWHRLRRKTKPHPRPALAGHQIGGITKLDLAAMLFEDSAHDREPKASAFFPGRDIGFKQPAAVFSRQPDAVVDHIDDDIDALADGRDADVTAAELVGRHRG